MRKKNINKDEIEKIRKVQFEEMFPWEFASAIQEAPICYIPLGVLEWHGEHNVVGLDTIKSHTICIKSAQQTGGIVIPPIYWATDIREDLENGEYLTGGVEHGERYHVPGNMFWIQPETFLNLLLDIYEAVRRRGFKVIVVVTGHWSEQGNLPVICNSGKIFLTKNPNMKWFSVIDQEIVPELHYPKEHAAGGETSLMMAIRPDLVDLSKTLETNGILNQYYQGQPEHLQRRRTTENKYIGVLTGEEDESNDPELTANCERGQILLKAISQRIADRAKALLSQVTES
ncbi:MAG: creatininase family protein [Anaerolineaceae bacterium]